MARQNINIGTTANDGTGDDLRVAMEKVNDNFIEVYAGTLAATTLEFTANNILSTGTNDAIVFVPNGTGTVDFPAIRINDNNIEGLRSNENLRIIPNGTGGIKLDASTDITGALGVTGNVTITGNLSITGEFENSGSAINVIDDAFVKLNSGNSEVDAGLIIETSDTDDARLFYDVSENYWVAGENATYSQIIRLTDAVSDGDATKGKVLKTTGAGNIKVTSLTLSSGATISSILDEDTMTSNSDTAVPTQQSVKAYVDTQLSSSSHNITFVGDDSTGTAVTQGETFKFAGSTNITTAVSGDTLTITGATNITANSISSADSSAIQINDSVNISGILSANTIDTNVISSGDSSAIQINDSVNISGILSANTVDTNVISSGDSSAITVNDNLNVSGNLTANSIIGEVVSVGSSGSPVTTNQTIDLSVTRFVEVYVNADVTLDFQNPQNGTIKRLVIINTGATIRNITYQIDSVTQDTKPIGDGSTTNTKQLYELYSFETQKLIASYEVLG